MFPDKIAYNKKPDVNGDDFSLDENGQVDTVVKPIFSEDYSRNMWKAINKAKSKKDLRDALYLVCCRIQELEDKIDKHIKNSV